MGMRIASATSLMSRPPRLAGFDYVGTHSYFLTICTNHREELFLDRALADLVVAQFRRTSSEMAFAVLAYCVMPDHLHLLVHGRHHTSDFRRFVKRLKQSTGQRYSHKAKRPLWQGSDRVDQRNPAGIRGVGTINHCVHGTTTIDEEILDWKPFRYFTFRGAWGLGIGRQMGGLLFTVELSPTRDGSGTHIAWRMEAGRGFKQRMLVRAYGAQLRSLIHTITENLTQLLMQAQAEAAERARAAPLS